MAKQELSLSKRVKICREKLRELEIKNPKHFFALKYREYTPKNEKDYNKLDNLFYGKIEDKNFTIKLESFVEFMKIQFS